MDIKGTFDWVKRLHVYKYTMISIELYSKSVMSIDTVCRTVLFESMLWDFESQCIYTNLREIRCFCLDKTGSFCGIICSLRVLDL